MGGMHICFNFQNAIGKHIENAGLDDPWTKAGVNAAHTTDAMLDGKAYYRAMRGHQLTCEALWHIKRPMFGLWLADNGHSHEVNVPADARNVAKVFQKSDGNCRAELCETFDKPSDILNTDNCQKLMKKFGEKCGCKSKGRTVRCSCFRKDIKCSYDLKILNDLQIKVCTLIKFTGYIHSVIKPVVFSKKINISSLK